MEVTSLEWDLAWRGYAYARLPNIIPTSYHWEVRVKEVVLHDSLESPCLIHSGPAISIKGWKKVLVLGKGEMADGEEG